MVQSKLSAKGRAFLGISQEQLYDIMNMLHDEVERNAPIRGLGNVIPALLQAIASALFMIYSTPSASALWPYSNHTECFCRS